MENRAEPKSLHYLLDVALDDFVTGESVDNTDVVLWYGAHFTHDVHHEAVGHIVGPTLRACWGIIIN